MDTEWHGLLDCGLGVRARRRFTTQCQMPLELRRFVRQHRTEIGGLVRLVEEARVDVALLDGLARLTVEVQEARARSFRALASRGITVTGP